MLEELSAIMGELAVAVGLVVHPAKRAVVMLDPLMSWSMKCTLLLHTPSSSFPSMCSSSVFIVQLYFV